MSPDIAIDADNTTHIIWLQKNPADVFYTSRSAQTGAWETIERISNNPWPSQAPSLAVGSDGTVHAVWSEYVGANSQGEADLDLYHSYLSAENGLRIVLNLIPYIIRQ